MPIALIKILTERNYIKNLIVISTILSTFAWIFITDISTNKSPTVTYANHINLKLDITDINMFLAYYKDIEVKHQIAELSHILVYYGPSFPKVNRKERQLAHYWYSC